MALIVGSITGVGIFNLPTSLAFYGPITLVSMALTTAGARGAVRCAVAATAVHMLLLTAVFATVTSSKLATATA